MRIVLLLFMLVYFNLEIDCQSYSIEGRWISLENNNKIYEFSSEGSLKIVWCSNLNRWKGFSIRQENKNILIQENKVVFDTLKIIDINKSKLTLYNTYSESLIHLIRATSAKLNKHQRDQIKNQNCEVKIYKGNTTPITGQVIRENHIIKEILNIVKFYCHFEPRFIFENYNDIQLIHFVLNEDGVRNNYTIVVEDVESSIITGHTLKNGHKVELTFDTKEIVTEIIDIKLIQGSYALYRDSIKLFNEISDSINTIHIGYSGYELKEDHSFTINDRSHDLNINGTWNLFKYKERTLITFDGQYEDRGLDNTYKEYFEIERNTEDYIILERKDCFSHGEEYAHRLYLRKLK